MIMIKIGYDNTVYGGSAQWCTFYIEDDFSSFMDYDGEKYYRNQLAPVCYCDEVQLMRDVFLKQFNDLNCVEDLDNVKGLLYVRRLYPNLPY